MKASPSCQHTQGGPWPAPSEVSQLRRSPAVPRQDWPGIANASPVAGHACNASIRIYCVTRFLCSQFDVPPPAAYLSPSPGRGCVPLECESILILKKKQTNQDPVFFTLPSDMPSKAHFQMIPSCHSSIVPEWLCHHRRKEGSFISDLVW